MGSLDLVLDLQVVGQTILIPSVEEKSEIKSINQSLPEFRALIVFI